MNRLKKETRTSFFALILLFISMTGFAQKKTYHIGILSDAYNVETTDYLFERLQKEVKAVVGEDADIIFHKNNLLSNNYNLKTAENNYQELLERCDIILSFGILNAKFLQQQTSFPKPVLVVSDLRDITTEQLSPISTSERHNLLYLTYSETILQRLNILKELTDFKTVGVVIGKHVYEIEAFRSQIINDLKGSGMQYKIITYQSLSDIINDLEGLDALLLEDSYSLRQSDIQRLSKVLIEKKIPSFSSVNRSDVENGIMATDISDDDINRFFRRIALSVEACVNGTNFSEQPVLIDFGNSLVINRTTALMLDIPMNYSMLGKVEFVNNPPINPKAEKVYDLPQLIAEVLRENLTLRSENKGIRISRQDVKLAKSIYLPKVTANANGVYLDPKMAELSRGSNPELSTTGNITIEQILFSAEANANIKIQQSLAQARQEKFNVEQLDIIFKAVNAYFNVLILKANVKIQANNLELTKRNLQIAEENFKAGQSGKTDLLRLRSQKAQHTQTLIEAINQLQISYNYINQLTNKELDYSVDIKEAGFEDDIFKEYNYDGFMKLANTPYLRKQFIEFLVQEAYDNSPEIKQLSHNLKAIEHKTKLYGAGRFLPQIALQGQYNHQFSKSGKGSVYPSGFPVPPNSHYNVGVSLSLPLFNRNSNYINKKTALLEKEQFELNKNNLRNGISLNIHNGILDLINEISNIELSKVSEKAAEEALDLTQNAYSTGAVNIVQLIDAQNNYIMTQQAKANATYNYLIKMLQLERYMGNYFLLSTQEETDDFNRRFLEFIGQNKPNESE